MQKALDDGRSDQNFGVSVPGAADPTGISDLSS